MADERAETVRQQDLEAENRLLRHELTVAVETNRALVASALASLVPSHEDDASPKRVCCTACGGTGKNPHNMWVCHRCGGAPSHEDSQETRVDDSQYAAHLSTASRNELVPEVCVCAALKLDDGRVIRGHRHDDCIQTAVKWRNAGQDIGHVSTAQQGFLTTRLRFVGRSEAAALMRDVGHVSARGGRTFTSNMLMSEDLY